MGDQEQHSLAKHKRTMSDATNVLLVAGMTRHMSIDACLWCRQRHRCTSSDINSLISAPLSQLFLCRAQMPTCGGWRPSWQHMPWLIELAPFVFQSCHSCTTPQLYRPCGVTPRVAATHNTNFVWVQGCSANCFQLSENCDSTLVLLMLVHAAM